MISCLSPLILLLLLLWDLSLGVERAVSDIQVREQVSLSSIHVFQYDHEMERPVALLRVEGFDAEEWVGQEGVQEN